MNNLYYINMQIDVSQERKANAEINNESVANSANAEVGLNRMKLWQWSLGHINIGTIKQMVSKGFISDIKINIDEFACEVKLM